MTKAKRIFKDKVISTIIGTAMPKTEANQDTDAMVYAEFLNEVSFENMSKYLFYNERFISEEPSPDQPSEGPAYKNGKPVADHPLNNPAYEGAKIWLVLSSDVDCDMAYMIGWNPTEYLFEYDLINFDDTDE